MPLHRNYARYESEVVLYSGLAEFKQSPVCDGIHAMKYDRGLLELQVKDNQASTTIVMFHAAIDPAKTTLPIFLGHSVAAEADANLIFVSEPALQRGVGIGWYAGMEGAQLQDDLVTVIQHIHSSFTRAQHLVFFGASAGGFAAMYYAHCFPGALAIVANPQTHIGKYHPVPVQRYLNECWSGLPLEEIPAAYDLTELYRDSFPSAIAYLQNLDDEFHLNNHLQPWRESVGESEHWRLHMGDWGPGHAPAPRPLLLGCLSYAAAVQGNWQEFLADDLFR